MPPLEHVPVAPMDPRRFESVLLPEEYGRLVDLIASATRELDGRVVWNVNSTARGGGVVELLRPLLGYSRGAGVDARWVVISGDQEFFAVTKRLHNHLHGFQGDRGTLGPKAKSIYERTLAGNARELVPLVGPRDIVILHDPQTAGLVGAMRDTGATVIWRCHVGRDHVNGPAHQAWDFLRLYVQPADAYVFSRAAFAWDGLPEEKIVVIQPSIDAFSPKNADQTHEQSLAILSRAAIVADRSRGRANFVRSDGTPGRVDRRAAVIEESSLGPGDSIVLQISRWDRLKDPLGVMRAFANGIAHRSDAHLVLAGPSTESVADDPEGSEVLAAVRDAWLGLPGETRPRVHLVSLPMHDIEENAAIVNALQRHANVVVQKSLAEGFGLTVSEAMWKARPVVASGIGGIEDQIVDGESGVLISNPRNLVSFADAVVKLLYDPAEAQRIGAAAHQRVRDHFLAPEHLARYFELIARLVTARTDRDPEAVGT